MAIKIKLKLYCNEIEESNKIRKKYHSDSLWDVFPTNLIFINTKLDNLKLHIRKSLENDNQKCCTKIKTNMRKFEKEINQEGIFDMKFFNFNPIFRRRRIIYNNKYNY